MLCMKGRAMANWKEKGAKTVFLLAASLCILALLLITVFIFMRGTPALAEIGLIPFLTGDEWQPGADVYGIRPMIIASLLLALLSVGLGTLIGLFTAVYATELAPKGFERLFRPLIDLLAGIPSVVFGLFGMTVLIPAIRSFAALFGLDVPGNSLLAGALVLAIMILPTVVATVQDALRAVPRNWRESSYALGASKIYTIFHVVIPAAKSGIITGVMLGVGRAIGETMAIILITGNRPSIPGSLFDPVRSMTGNIALEMGYATGLHEGALFATGVVLFVFTMIINGVVRFVSRKRSEKGA